MSTEAVLTFQDVTKRYQSGDFWRPLKAVALKEVSFQLGHGEVFGLIGLNGAGKSTLMKTAVGLLRPDSGQVSLFGMDPRSREARRRFGFLPELPYFPGYLSAWEVLHFYGELHGIHGSQLKARVQGVLEVVNLAYAAKEPIRRYSKGMQQRVGLAQTLLHDPELLFLDEPMSGLDPQGMKEMRDVILAQRSAGKTIFFNSHSLAEVERICDRVALMHKGRLVLVDSVAELVRSHQSSVTLGFPGKEELGAQLEAMGFKARRENKVWTLVVANHALGDAFGRLSQVLGSPPSVLSFGSPLETAFLDAVAREDAAHA
jgi:ABC-2 type transport system ATP-binding protein